MRNFSPKNVTFEAKLDIKRLNPHVMKRIYFVISLSLVCSSVFAQLVKAKPHTLELASGVSMDGELIVYAQPITSPPVFQIDQESVSVSDVRFFRNSHGYFANLEYADQAKSGFAMRIKKGNVDLFERVDIDLYGKSELAVTSDRKAAALKKMAQGMEFQYFSVDGKKVKRANYSNLRMDLQSNPESVEFLKGLRRYQWLQRGLIAAGSSLLIGSYTAQGSNPKFTPAMALGIVLGGSSFFCKAPKDDYQWMAVEAYNRN